MSKHSNFYDTVDQIISYGIEKKILHLYTHPQRFNSMQIMIGEKPVINFGSCSYLGLEFHPALKSGAQLAIDKYGTQFSASRAYISLGLYKELETLLQQIFTAPVVVTPTTTLGHLACIPVVADDADAIIMDHQLHNSVQTAVGLVKARGVHTELIRHNRMDLLEERIKILRGSHRKIWYMADGIYSMFGDCCPVDTVYQLMDRYPELHFYVDDAHGMSIHGKHGKGFVLANRNLHPKMIMATSLNKAFASGGGVLVFADKALAAKVGNVGGPLLSSGPMQPGSLGAAIASARIHLSDEIAILQQELRDNIGFTRLLLAKYKLPVISDAGAAIFFIGVSLPKLGHNIVQKMLAAGFYVNLGVFPTVPMKQTGIRFTVTRLHTFHQITAMIAALAKVFPGAMKEEGIRLGEIYKAFKKEMPEEIRTFQSVDDLVRQSLTLETFHYKSINEIEKSLWNEFFMGKGTFDWEGLLLLERSFKDNPRVEDNWQFDYFIVKDTAGNTIAATFFTTALWKDDMLSPAGISIQLESMRKEDPYYLTSTVVCCGSLLTEGEHLFLDFQNPLWKDAMQLVYEKAYALQDAYRASQVVLRDFHTIQPQLDTLMVDNGFFRVQMPDTHTVSSNILQDPGGLLPQLTKNAKRQLQKKVLKHLEHFTVTIKSGNVSAAEMDHWYRLYLNVKNNNPALNTFALPAKLFRHICENEHWEIIELKLKQYAGDKACCVVFCNKESEAYIPVIIGIDYRYNKDFSIYRQALYQVVRRAGDMGKKRILMGFSAGTEKQKMGAIPSSAYAYVHTTDSYNAQALASLSMLTKARL